MKQPIIIAIDGPGASGKGTLARRLAAHFGYAYLDTGAIYRAVALLVLQAGDDPADPRAALAAARMLDAGALNDPQLRTDRIGAAASQIAAHEGVRQALLAFQRDFAARPPGNAAGAVLDGRDIGTVICPEAQAKLYVTASAAARAHRRYLELAARGEAASEAEVLDDLRARDARDLSRAAAPLRPAEDAHLLDTTNLSIDDAFAVALAAVSGKIAPHG
ncbi:MAG: (d)CMP kinase [Pseudomonadota bacterium]